MATYVNDLRLTELATGEGSGTWGTTTNTSLELIGEALGYATQQAFGSDADATTTVADGVSDPARAMYYKITSAASLTATRTLTIAPNTISRVMFIENATSGSQSIAISQGSGANVTILTGKTAVVYLDGAGATAAVVDAMAGVDPGVTDTLTEVLVAGNTSGGTNIELSTTDKVQFRDAAIYLNSSVDGQLDIVADTEIQIAATTVDLNGNLDVSGTALVTGVLTTTAATVFNGGFASNADSTLGTDKKVQFRDSAIYINSSVDGQLDIVADTEIQIAATTIDVNGTLAFDSLKGTGATTVTNILDEDNMASDSATAIATQQSIKAYVDAQVGTVDTLAEVLANGNTTGGTDLDISIGDDLTTLTAGTSNFRAGVNAGNSIESGGNYNTVVGDEAGTAITTSSWNTAVGYNSLALTTTGAQNVSVGAYALDANTTGAYNTAVGMAALDANTTASNNTAVGYFAMNANTTGTRNVAVGALTLDANTTGVDNVGVGESALTANTTAANNTALGSAALQANTTGAANTAVGRASFKCTTQPPTTTRLLVISL
jgi:trimeric autotransporter adhesin